MVNFAGIVSDVNYGLGLLSSFGQRVDVVGIYGQKSLAQMFEAARPMKATVRETSKIMQHPVETGNTLSDHHIINPTEIEIPLILSSQDYSGTFTQIRQAFLNATLLSVKTRVGVYSDMIIADMPHEEDADMYDVITIGLHLKQAIFILPGTTNPVPNFQPLNPINSDTVISGLKSAVAISSSVLRAATAVASYANVRKFL